MMQASPVNSDCALDVRVFGAIGDGVTTAERGATNRTALEQAVAAAMDAGVPLHIPCGRYYVEISPANWIRLGGNLTVFGDGSRHSVLLFGPDPLPSNRAALEVVDEADVQVERLQLIGPADHARFTCIGFNVYNSGARLRVRHALVARFSHPFRCEVGGSIDLDDCFLEHGNVAMHGVAWSHDSPMCGAFIHARNCRFRYRSVLSNHEGSQALYAGHGVSVDISHCHVESLGQAGENAFQSFGDHVADLDGHPKPSVTFLEGVTRVGSFQFHADSNTITGPAQDLTGIQAGSLLSAFNHDIDVPLRNNGLLGRITDVQPGIIAVSGALTDDGPVSAGLQTAPRIVRSPGSWLADGFKLNTTIGDVSGTASNNGRVLGKVIGISDDTLDLAAAVLITEGPVAGVTLRGFSQPDFVKYTAITVSEKASNAFQTNDYCPATITDCTSSVSGVDIFTNNARAVVRGFVSLGTKRLGVVEATALTEGALIQGCDFRGSYSSACVALLLKWSTGLLEVVDSNLTNRDHVFGGSGLIIGQQATAVNVKIVRSVLSVETAATGVGAAATLFGGGSIEFSDCILTGIGSFGRGIEVTAAAADLNLALIRNKLTSAAGYGSGLMIDCPAASYKGEITFSASLRTIVRTTGTWPNDPHQTGSYRSGQTVVISGSNLNNGRRGRIHHVSGDTITLVGDSVLIDEGPVTHVTVSASFVVTLLGADNEFQNPSGYGPPRVTGGGIVQGWLAPPDRMGPNIASESILTLSPNHARRHVTGTETINTLRLGVVPGGGVDAEYLFGGGRFVLIADGAWSLSDTGNVKPRTLAARTAGSAVVLSFDPTDGYWHEET